MTNNTPKGSRLHIAVFGRRNAGKSSFINRFINQELSIVSSTPGTTTDPVEKAYELQPFGPVVLIDTAGIDDIGDLGEQRIKKTKEVIKRTDLAIMLLEQGKIDTFEEDLIKTFKNNDTKYLLVISKQDLIDKSINLDELQDTLKEKYDTLVLTCSATNNLGFENIKNATIKRLEQLTPTPPIIADLLTPPDLVVLVIPIDKEAPAGRLILPQVQTIRELLDADIASVAVKEKELKYVLDHSLKEKPKIVVTDSQAFLKVDADVPDDILMTSFSMLFARQKGDLTAYVRGAKAIDSLKDGDSILIAELCSHRPISEDIGRVKIPRWLKQYKGINLNLDIAVGKDYPENLTKYKIIIQCGGCVVNRTLIQSRIKMAIEQNVPITNYGVCIAYLHGILDRALEPFPDALYEYEKGLKA